MDKLNIQDGKHPNALCFTSMHSPDQNIALQLTYPELKHIAILFSLSSATHPSNQGGAIVTDSNMPFLRVISNKRQDIYKHNLKKTKRYLGSKPAQGTSRILEAFIQLNPCLGLIDYQKAFNSIEHIDICDALRKVVI